MDRGQTLPDFAVGVAVFLVAVSAVFLFVPQLALPYEDQERPAVAQRVAGDLVGDLLAEPGGTSELNETCTLAFFEGSGGAGCPFDPDEGVADRLGVASSYAVNVSLRDAPSDDPGSKPLCETGGYDSVTDCDSGGERLAVGPPVPADDRSVSLARRRARVGETPVVVEVGVW